ncbi:MAG: hypothetical protein A2857_01325 [Candidatus Levybacteria bacterium RIFCSPHIGHO2_01_FULL_36_15]|nr:MAG: hypothetical protein A2857_01325 [Candidatus Levybacteria bacterium RIFCSPHIGHO2_01_FULL_36_15]OGH38788.1 MAG: hypothetical protein A2905_02385 [Candidatus Levybacteria bacterium RIFCSPLOWO2_01_FULL_36_10]
MKSSIFEKPYKFCPNCKTKLVRKNVECRKLLSCLKCSFVFWNNPKPVVSVLLNDGKKILMLKRANEPFKNFWCFPGGFMDYGETPETAIKREAKEEIGLDIKIGKLIGVYSINNDPRGANIDIVFEGKTEKNINLSYEHSDYKYFDKNHLPEKIAYKHLQAVKDWIKH